MAAPAISGSFAANLFRVSGSQPLTVNRFIPAAKPGNVAVCLSGGGSRALTAGMGQLRALETMQLNGASLLSQVKALSTVSGGSWVGVPFVYLTTNTGDSSYLNTYADPSQLTLSSIASLPSGNIASHVTHEFSIPALALKALILHFVHGVPENMLWQTVIAMHMLEPYGLFTANSNFSPASFFTYDAATRASIAAANPPLTNEPGSVVAQVPGQSRPYLVCNLAMFVTANGETLLAPVQATPFMTGIVSVPPGATDANGHAVGGGGVDSFAFSSSPTAASTSAVTVQQTRQWALADIVGTSSAAFAALLQSTIAEWAKHPVLLSAVMSVHGPAVKDFMARKGADTAGVDRFLTTLSAAAAGGNASVSADLTNVLSGLIPSYDYWPVLNTPIGAIDPTQFADAGSLDNTGINAMLAYSDIDNVISFLNSETRLEKNGVVKVDDMIPPLFGFQPYDPVRGYVPYTQPLVKASNIWFKNNQVFDSAAFDDLLNGIWTASGAGTFKTSPIYMQRLTTVANNWFGVAGGRSVRVLWVYLENAMDWRNALRFDVRAVADLLMVTKHFPHFNTLDTELTPIDINLMSNLSAWSVAGAENAAKFTAMFQP